MKVNQRSPKMPVSLRRATTEVPIGGCFLFVREGLPFYGAPMRNLLRITKQIASMLWITGPMGLMACDAPPERAAVVVTLAPIHSLTASLMTGIGEPALLEQKGNLHDAALRPSQARALRDANLVIWVGPTLEPSLAGLLSQRPASAVLTIEALASLDLLPPRGQSADTDRVDPHIWISPSRSRVLIGEITDRLIKLDPGNKAAYLANANALSAELEMLEKELNVRMMPLGSKTYIVHHDAFQYFEEDFGLEPLLSLESANHMPSSVAHMTEIYAEIEAFAPTCLLIESGPPSVMASRVAGQTGLALIEIDPTGQSIPAGPLHYQATLRGIANAFVTCLGD